MIVFFKSLAMALVVELSKRVVGYFIKQSVPPDIRDKLPIIFDELDTAIEKSAELDLSLPTLLNTIITTNIDRYAVADDIASVIRLYDPLVHATKMEKKRLR